MEFDHALARLAEGVVVDLDVYRETQCKKYYAERGTEHLGDYTKLERYKNRVRIVDCILPHLERFLHDMGVINVTLESLQQGRTQID